VAHLPIWTGNRPIERLEGPDSLNIAANQVPKTPVATFSAKDPDLGTIFSYKITEGNEDEAFQIELRTGVLTLNKPGKTFRKLLVEVQDNCIPLSKASKSLAVTFE
ncbi:MAG: cadherin repeat domain-containing protein, partial [Verrucomicrobiota bacterium]